MLWMTADHSLVDAHGWISWCAHGPLPHVTYHILLQLLDLWNGGPVDCRPCILQNRTWLC